uniref:Cysteine rich transmembrane BMP regulator 1 (Chordin like) n=1 Tax=Poecilia formosa TaxID=48698 RepID=A0A087XYX7_POEFO
FTAGNMFGKSSVMLLSLLVLVRALLAHECTPCNLRTCPVKVAQGCEGGRSVARDPCGCCDHCARLEWEPCGGQDWTHGYCALGLTCASINSTGAATMPEIGVCKRSCWIFSSNVTFHPCDERCPLITGCDKAGAECVCDARYSCLGTFTYPDQETCMKASKSAEELRCAGVTCPALQLPSCPKGSVLTKSYTPPAGCCPSMPPQCTCDFRACNKTHCPSGQHAVLISQASGRPGDCCDIFECQKGNSTEVHTTHFDCSPSQKQLHSWWETLLTPTVHLWCCTCYVVSMSHTAPTCFVLGAQCWLSGGMGSFGAEAFESPPKVSPNCVFNGKKFSEGEVYRMDPCWLCQCRGGISFCSKAECGELDCEKFYIPEGECCPVCIEDVIYKICCPKASCWVNNKLRTHEEQWKEDDCTFCQCVDGDPHCTAMACKQSCQNPVKIPGECCPFCEEPSYETVSPLLCPPLENCSLSGNECPYGFQQDHNGCLLCQCLNNDSCPDLGKYCPLQCPTGYEKDDLGCEVCECSIPTPKCRTLTCTKTCPYGYVRNKHGCEMCRCVKCPPLTCDKYCSNGYRQNKKGCNICMCKEIDQVPSTTVPASMPSFCLTSNGRRYEEGDSWHDGCRDCYCLSGREMCVLISCPMPSCSQPVVKSDQCCPTCEDESGSGQPEGMDMVVCRAPGGELYVEGETWNLDECTRCTCRKGRVLCDTEVCPPALCQTPIRNKDTCCHMCPEETESNLLPVNGSQQEFCITAEGDMLQAGDSWKANACTSCTCSNGTIQCFSQHCPAASCRVPVLLKGQCCPHCLGYNVVIKIKAHIHVSISLVQDVFNLGSVNVAVTVQNQTCCSCIDPFFNQLISANVCPSIHLCICQSVPLEQTNRGPQKVEHLEIQIHKRPMSFLSHIDQPRLGENYPSHTEMALVYQSAAWILAGLLLAIIIFLIVALLINKKKKWVQMSCYSAPKK